MSQMSHKITLCERGCRFQRRSLNAAGCRIPRRHATLLRIKSDKITFPKSEKFEIFYAENFRIHLLY